MNEYIPSQDLETLIAHHGKPAVSIFLPTTRIPTRVQAESLQFKNLVRDAEEQLAQFDLRGPQIRAMLEPARTLIADSDFWRHQKDGLAVFIAEDFFIRYQVPNSFEAGLFVGESFHLKPLLPLLTSDITFYILAVSQNNVRFVRCTRYSAQEIDPETMPSGMREILDLYEIEKQVQFHTSTAAPGTGRRGAIFYGQGAGEGDDDKTRLREYFGRIDQVVHEYLRQENAPLVFAGVDYLFPIYREANTYPNLVESSVVGNPDELSLEELHRPAWRLIEPGLIAKQNADIELFHSSLPHDLASTNLRELVPWADKGRIEAVFINKRAEVWGVYDQERFEAEEQLWRTPNNRDLVDMVALYTLLRKGRVYLMSPEQMEMEFGPGNRHQSAEASSSSDGDVPVAAAIYRFAV